MKRDMYPVFFIGFFVLILSGRLGQDSFAAEPLSETDILTYLPAGSRLADDIPIVQFGTMQEKRPNIFYADTDGDGEKEIIVAYYTLPHEYGDNPENAEAYFRRAHVKVLDWDGSKYVNGWDSGGWGMLFIAGMSSKLSEIEQQRYSANYFNVLDMTGDGVPEILFTRRSFLAEGTQFEVWSWNETTYEQIALLPTKVIIEDQDADGKKEIVRDRDYKGRKLVAPAVFKLNSKVYQKQNVEK